MYPMDYARAYFVRKHLLEADQAEKAPAGWFRDPRGEAPYRFWDGESWDEATSPLVDAPLPIPSDLS